MSRVSLKTRLDDMVSEQTTMTLLELNLASMGFCRRYLECPQIRVYPDFLPRMFIARASVRSSNTIPRET